MEFKIESRYGIQLFNKRDIKVRYMIHRKSRINKKWKKKYGYIKIGQEDIIFPIQAVSA